MTAAQTCATCAFWTRKAPQIADATRDPSCPADRGTCRAAPPAIASNAGLAVSLFPRTHQDCWCGGWKPGVPIGPGGGEVIVLRSAAA